MNKAKIYHGIIRHRKFVLTVSAITIIILSIVFFVVQYASNKLFFSDGNFSTELKSEALLTGLDFSGEDTAIISVILLLMTVISVLVRRKINMNK